MYLRRVGILGRYVAIESYTGVGREIYGGGDTVTAGDKKLGSSAA